ncbi:MAG TPA: rhomboid-like protein [Streptosporangiaceae bacterium]|nr:rhomboid-like protein [Streptosporangiaceae bacterium]
MSGAVIRSVFTRYAVAWFYLVAVTGAEIVFVLLSRRDRTDLLSWASTSVHNLEHDPLTCLAVSAFFPQASLIVWPAVIALAVFGANHMLGNWRTAVTCAAGQVIGTIVSEGIVGYRVSHGALPPAARYLIDVGPSYVVVSAIAVALLYGGWLVRAAAALDLLLLIFIGDIFSGFSRLAVAPVGHATALGVGALLGGLLVWQRSHASEPSAAGQTAASAPD